MAGAEVDFNKTIDQKSETFLFTSESVGEGHPGFIFLSKFMMQILVSNARGSLFGNIIEQYPYIIRNFFHNSTTS